ncbi:MAG TPA: O-methyltransferase [Flavobacteriales bacterium]|nr:O-methyltransferase [Flavobacteriales bacterium]HIB76764.1 O-methyltransferase [Flavobacteriales bacterium]HIN41412.1 O-methyltransferase [Flavobacteriales bacterium]HIO15663.1 O-methyltransferase [Flavobacteriales bacterium]
MAHFEDATNEYSTVHSSSENDVLSRLRRATWLSTTKPQMLSDPLQGRFLSMISKMVKPNRILEFGTFTGYSTICLSEGLTGGGEIDTLEINDELEDIQKKFYKEAGLNEVITRHYGHALEIIKSGILKGGYDLVWIDADKEHQIEYVEFAIKNLNPGGWLLVDNVIWGGAVLDKKKLNKPDSGASRIHRLNQHIANHEELENVLLPVWDGVQIARKVD